MDGMKPLPSVGGIKRLWDARELLTSMGVKFDKEAFATYDAVEETLTAFLSNEDQKGLGDLIEIPFYALGRVSSIHLEFIIAEFELPTTVPISGRTFLELEQAAGTSWAIRENTIVATQSGNTAKFEAFGAPRKPEQSGKTPTESAPMQPGERGTQIEAEPTIGPDGKTCNINFTYRRGGRLPGSEDDLDVSVTTSVAATCDSGTIVHLWTLPPRKDVPAGLLHYAALVLRPTLVLEAGHLEKQILNR